MAETINIGEISNKLSEDIFKFFHWHSHPKRDHNFKCLNAEHVTDGDNQKPKLTHPGDVVYFYQDPYLGKRVCLHTDLKSYGKKSISAIKIRAAIKSLAMSVECARRSSQWREIYSVADVDHEVRGLLFVHNHDHQYVGSFKESLKSTDLSTIPIAPHVYIHILGPDDINRLYSIAQDIIKLTYERTLPEEYTFFYPDLVMWHRHGDIWNQPATIEAITAPYFSIKYKATAKSPSGYLIYYNRQGASREEFEYFLDSLSRYQMLEAGEFIRIRIVHKEPNENYKSHFDAAKQSYAKAWGFDTARQDILDEIRIQPISSFVSAYAAPEIGWRGAK